MASFSDELREAAKNLHAFNAIARAATTPGSLAGAAATRAGASASTAANVTFGVSAGMAAAGLAYDAAAAGAKFLTPAASAYAVTGSSQAFASAVTKSTLSAIESNAFGGLLLGATGISAAKDTNERAGQGVLSVTEDLARIGVDVSDKQRKELFDLTQSQEKRVTKERGKVAEIADSAAALAGARPEGAGAGFDGIFSILVSIEGLLRGFTGGRN